MYRLHVGSIFAFLALVIQALAALQYQVSPVDGRSLGWWSVDSIRTPPRNQIGEIVRARAENGYNQMQEDRRHPRKPAVMAALYIDVGQGHSMVILASSIIGTQGGKTSPQTTDYCAYMEEHYLRKHKHGNCAEIHALALARQQVPHDQWLTNGAIAAYGKVIRRRGGKIVKFLTPCKSNEEGDRDGCLSYVEDEGLQVITKRAMRIEPKPVLDEADQSKSTDDTTILAEH